MTGYLESSKHRILTREEEVVLGRTVIDGIEAGETLDSSKKLTATEKRKLRALVKYSSSNFFLFSPPQETFTKVIYNRR